MTELIELGEYQDWIGRLGAEDAHFIERELRPSISLRTELRDGQHVHVLNPNQYVGVVTLPSGTRLECRPRFPVRNLFYMLAVVYDLPFWREERAQFDRLDELLEFMAEFFAAQTEVRINHGLHREYVEQEENLATVRGRVVFAEDARQNYVLRHRTYCRYAEFSWDIPENQILKQVVYLLAGWGFRPGLRLQLGRIDAELGGITRTLLPASALDRISYHRLNEDYRPLHQLCRLFLEGASLSERAGPVEFRAFLVDMNELFERFVTRVLQQRAPRHTVVYEQENAYLDVRHAIPIRPDIVVRIGGNALLIADCKYKKIEQGEFRNQDVYQVLAYCTAARSPQGALFYPTYNAEVRGEVLIRNSEVLIREITLDLGRELEELVEECDRFARRVFSWLTNV